MWRSSQLAKYTGVRFEMVMVKTRVRQRAAMEVGERLLLV
jgi:hypothetical protein